MINNYRESEVKKMRKQLVKYSVIQAVIRFTRASSALCVNPDTGLITTVGANIPREIPWSTEQCFDGSYNFGSNLGFDQSTYNV